MQGETVFAGEYHSLGLLDNGQVVGWGANSFGQRDVPVPPEGTRFIQVAVGDHHSLGLLDNGQVLGWERIGCKRNRCSDVPEPPEGTRFIQVAVGDTHLLGLLDNGQVIGWGIVK